MSIGRTIPAGPAVAACGASVLTTCAVIASLDHWGGEAVAQPLRGATIGAWVVFAVAAATSLILAELRDLTGAMNTAIEDFGLEQHSDGANEGFQRANAEHAIHLTPFGKPR